MINCVRKRDLKFGTSGVYGLRTRVATLPFLFKIILVLKINQIHGLLLGKVNLFIL